jgi:hypothetical protein
MTIDPSSLTWQCDICHQERPDRKITVHKVDIGPRNLPPGTMVRNIKYCSDNLHCEEAARNWDEEEERAKARVR